jgi:hypothetical protein
MLCTNLTILGDGTHAVLQTKFVGGASLHPPMVDAHACHGTKWLVPTAWKAREHVTLHHCPSQLRPAHRMVAGQDRFLRKTAILLISTTLPSRRTAMRAAIKLNLRLRKPVSQPVLINPSYVN